MVRACDNLLVYTVSMPLDYLTSTSFTYPVHRASLHLLVWKWAFFTLAAMVAGGSLVSAYTLIRHETGFALVLLLIIAFAFAAMIGLVLWVMGQRCARALRGLLTGNRADSVWALHAFGAMIAFSLIGLFFAFLLVGFLNGLESWLGLGVFVGAFALPLAFATWTYRRVAQAMDHLDHVAGLKAHSPVVSS